jgi:hypothetical protein
MTLIQEYNSAPFRGLPESPTLNHVEYASAQEQPHAANTTTGPPSHLTFRLPLLSLFPFLARRHIDIVHYYYSSPSRLHKRWQSLLAVSALP